VRQATNAKAAFDAFSDPVNLVTLGIGTIIGAGVSIH